MDVLAMKLRHPALIRGLGFAAAWLARGWMSTLRVRIDDRASGPLPPDVRQQRYIYVLWHENIIFTVTHFSGKIDALVSTHADGELITQIMRNLGIGAVRGSSG